MRFQECPIGETIAMEKKFTRECPKCKKVISYTTEKGKRRAIRSNKPCLSCSLKLYALTDEGKKQYNALSDRHKKKYMGENNPFYGKRHTRETIDKLKSLDRSYTQKDSFRETMSNVTSGKNNPMYGKSVYDIWVAKYGKNYADNRKKEIAEIKSKKMSGKNNPMYGKPSPKGSGGGWSGWYNNWYFRSLRELSYMINVIEKNNLKWRSAEGAINIPYIDFKGRSRTYRPDFIIEESLLLEIKPKKLMFTDNNRRKVEAAKIFCKDNDMEYRIIDVKIMPPEQLKGLYLDGKIKFIKKWDDVFIKEFLLKE